MYESPIEIIQKTMTSNLLKAQEDAVLHAVCEVGINVNKEELIKALAYDRDQYSKGYEDAREAYEQKWTLCSKRLPNKDERIKAYIRKMHASQFLAMIEGADMPTVLYLTWDNYWKDDNWTDYRVTAWMPLPEPYEEEA